MMYIRGLTSCQRGFARKREVPEWAPSRTAPNRASTVVISALLSEIWSEV